MKIRQLTEKMKLIEREIVQDELELYILEEIKPIKDKLLFLQKGLEDIGEESLANNLQTILDYIS